MAQYLVGILGAIAAQQELWSLLLLSLPTVTVYLTSKRNAELQDTTRTLLEHMADTVDLRDPYTGGHSRRVTEYTRGILEALGTQGPDVGLIIAAARVHDIGKIAMPDHVLLKSGKLSDEEWTIMRQHPEQGADLLARYPDFRRGVDIVRHHHERWDGEGYPHRLRELAIPFGARVIAVADSYDAMTSDRPYRKGMTPQKAAAILREGRGRQWDPQIVDAFLRSVADQLEQPAPLILRLVPKSGDTSAASA
jgi:HD-GYP domain-containing protein (c-di-GMP phosphodiesterase class II)